jgi:hypothetical protein
LQSALRARGGACRGPCMTQGPEGGAEDDSSLPGGQGATMASRVRPGDPAAHGSSYRPGADPWLHALTANGQIGLKNEEEPSDRPWPPPCNWRASITGHGAPVANIVRVITAEGSLAAEGPAALRHVYRAPHADTYAPLLSLTTDASWRHPLHFPLWKPLHGTTVTLHCERAVDWCTG